MCLNIFQMTTAVAQTYWCGIRPHPRFLEQKQFACHKPTLNEAMSFVNNLRAKKNKASNSFLWNIEIKSLAEWDGMYHPIPKEYVGIGGWKLA